MQSHVLILLLTVLWHGTKMVATAMNCHPHNYLCSWECPALPPGQEVPKTEAPCYKDPDSDTCVCWLHNPSSQLQLFFQCEARVNNSVSKIACIPPSQCFMPDPNLACLVILHCDCLLFDQTFQGVRTDEWLKVKAVVHTKKKDPQNSEGHSIEKIQSDVREFSMKHLLFLLGFVIAPLLCWCLLNFFHEGKCRKKPLQAPEAQPIPTTRSSTVDNMNNEEGENHVEVISVLSASGRPVSVQSQTFSIQVLPTAPLEDGAEVQPQAPVKYESPPPYCDSTDRVSPQDIGPPPTYEDAMRGTDINVQQLWQTVFILEPGARENS